MIPNDKTDANSFRQGERSQRRRLGKRRARRGAAMLELALVLPMLLIPILGGVDYARFVYTRICLINAVREGAFYGSIHVYTPATQELWATRVRETVAQEMLYQDATSQPLFDATKLTITDLQVTDRGNDRFDLRVRAEYPFKTIIPWPGISQDLTVSAESEMRFTE